MAKYFDLRTVSYFGTTTRYDFLDSDNLQLVAGSVRHLRSNDDRVTTTFELVAHIDYMTDGLGGAATRSTLYGRVSGLEDVLEFARLWHQDKLNNDGALYLFIAGESETEKGYLIYDYEITPVDGPIIDRFVDSKAAYYRVAITHSANGEIDTVSNDSETALSLNGGVWSDVTLNNISDHLVARIRKLTIDPTGSLDKVWLGFKPSYTASMATFQALFEAEDGSINPAIADTSVAGATGASGGQVMRCNFASTEDMTNRFSVQVAGGSYPTINVMRGRYTVLMRYKFSNTTTTVGVRIGLSYASLAAKGHEVSWYETQYFSANTDWLLSEMGTIQLPPDGYRDALLSVFSNDIYMYINVGLERIDGSGAIDIDEFILIPADHQAIIEVGCTSAQDINLLTNEDGEVIVVVTDAGGDITASGQVNAKNWGFPRDNGALVIAGQESNSHTATETADIDIVVMPTWGWAA